jgi:RNA polymerase sigma-32 factor
VIQYAGREWQDWLVDDRADQETSLAASEEFGNRRRALASALSVLSARERRILEARRLAEHRITLNVLAGELGVSRERVRQIELRSVEKLQNAMKDRIGCS